MSIFIQDMEMPKGNSTINVLIYADGTVYTGHVNDSQYFAVSVPTPHGRLIDADVLKDWIEAWFTMHRGYHPYSKSNLIPSTELIDIIDRLPTIIEAEGENNG